MSEMVPSGVRLGIVRGISYGLFGKPEEFVPELRELGATLVRVYFYWSQIEPEPGDYTFDGRLTHSWTSSTAPRRSGSPSAQAHGGRPSKRPTSCRRREWWKWPERGWRRRRPSAFP